MVWTNVWRCPCLFRGVPSAASSEKCMISGRPLFSRFGSFFIIWLCREMSSICCVFLPFLFGVLVVSFLLVFGGIVSSEDSARISVNIFLSFCFWSVMFKTYFYDLFLVKTC